MTAHRLAMLALAVAAATSGACRKAEPASTAAAGASASTAASASGTWDMPPKPTEPVLLGNEASYFTGTRAADAIEDVRVRNGGSLELLDLHVYPARIVLKAKDAKGDAIQRWEIRTTGVIGPKTEGLSAKKLEDRLFEASLVPLASLPTTASEAVAKSGLANGSVTLLDVRRGKNGGVSMRLAVHAAGATKWVDVDVPKK